MEKSFKEQLADALARRQAVDKSTVKLPTPEELNRQKVEAMLTFNSRYGSFGTAQK
ncbi:ATP-binding protein [Kosakonia phage Kc263]|uniref:ATP-binding protein n=1 Tax=Kosakonia phage Kc263 TaxID=2863194 RepID=A0AAE7WF48_9CAUD|nr:ATP-binding protein [Kosakonia phage Kc263]QYN79923.1 ATP-binding protein [Kosakonia phage Kc263]